MPVTKPTNSSVCHVPSADCYGVELEQLMSEFTETVECRTHSTQPSAFVCQHIAQGLIDRYRVGFFWTAFDPSNPRPDAWCSECEKRVQATNGDWIDEALINLQPKILCGACYDVAKAFHMGTDPWS